MFTEELNKELKNDYGFNDDNINECKAIINYKYQDNLTIDNCIEVFDTYLVTKILRDYVDKGLLIQEWSKELCEFKYRKTFRFKIQIIINKIFKIIGYEYVYR